MNPSPWYEAFQDPAHAVVFSRSSRRYATRRLIQKYARYNETKLLRSLAATFQPQTIADVGCGTGRFYPILKALWPAASYAGFDISAVAIATAKTLYPRGDFHVLDGSLQAIPQSVSDLVFARDVVPHSLQIPTLLSELYAATGTYLLLRLRTREEGQTVYDPEQSCAYYCGHWIPYIVMNMAELLERLRSLAPPPSQIIVRRHPVILGGQNSRFLPKPLYLPETGTAETAVLVKKGPTDHAPLEPLLDIATSPERDTPAPLAGLFRRLARALRI